MPTFTCEKCNRDVTYPLGDRSFHRAHEWECLDCYTVIAADRYEKNVPDHTTVFMPIGFALGDQIVNSVVLRYYQDQNPDENVVVINTVMFPDEIKTTYHPDKFFWSDVAPYKPAPTNAILYSVPNEANALKEKGYYPELWFTPERPEVYNELQFKNYVVLHIRNVSKAAFKNEEPKRVNKIIEYLLNSESVDCIVLVGNDNDDPRYATHHEKILDLRKKLKLEEIALIIQHSLLYVGKDSGIAHLAGCCNAPMVVYGYVTERWMPKVKHDRMQAFMEIHSSVDNIVYAINDNILQTKLCA